MTHKVLAYITRLRDEALQLLVFTHRDFPEAGIQVPGGTVEPNEPPERALFREVLEEAGLRAEQLRLERKLAEHASTEWQTVRHVFHLAALTPLPDTWSQVVHGDGEDNGMAFEYYWIAVPAPALLAGDQGQWLPALTRSEAA